MKFIKGFVKKDINELKQRGWYHQRFDGCPMFLDLISEAELRKESRKALGGEFTSHLVWFGTGAGDWYIEQNDIERMSELIFRKSFNLKRIINKKLIAKLNDMEKKNGLIKINFSNLQNKKWYHQQADGCLFAVEAVVEPYTDKEKRRKNCEYKHICLLCKDELGHWYHDQDDLRRITKNIADKAQKQVDFSKKLMKKWKKDEDKFFTESKKFDKIDFKKLSDKELKRQFVSYVETYLKSVTSSSIIDGFALGTDELIQTEIRNFLKTIGKEETQYQCFTTLTAPITQSFINEAEISLLRVADLVKNGKDYQKALAIHTKNYFWTKNNYNSAYVLTEEDFMKEIEAMIKGTGEGVDFKKEIERIKSTPIKSQKEKEKLIRQINLPKYIRNLLTISEDFTYWQDERKKKTFLMTHCGFRFLQEIARRTDYETEELKYFVYPELVALLDSKKTVSRTEAQARKRGCLFYHKGDKYEVVMGVEAEKFKKEIFDKELETEVNDFRGMPASRGRVRGKVKIVMSVKELDKIEPGDILVAVMTRPDYIAGIKRAAAIVTNEGGVTCHAAIVSRELGIPCVIGTKIATRVLKDGDEVEVNANHGVVTVVKRK